MKAATSNERFLPWIDAEANSQRDSRLVFALVLGLTIVAITILMVNPTGWLGSDDAAYHSAAEQVLCGSKIERLHHHYARLAMILPIVVSMWSLGDHVTAVILPTFLASIICMWVVIALGKSLWGWWEGLVAAGIVAMLPYYRVLSTTAFPDVHVCLWCSVSMFLAVKAAGVRGAYSIEKNDLFRADGPSRQALLAVLSGFTLGAAISAKVFAIACALPTIMILLHRGSRSRAADSPQVTQRPSRWKLIFLYTGGWALFLLMEGAFYHVVSGDFLFPLRAAMHSQSNVPGMTDDATGASHLADIV